MLLPRVKKKNILCLKCENKLRKIGTSALTITFLKLYWTSLQILLVPPQKCAALLINVLCFGLDWQCLRNRNNGWWIYTKECHKDL